VATERIKKFLGATFEIYADSPPHVSPPTLTLGDIIGDVYTARNAFAHGNWLPEEFTARPGYRGVRGESLSYADVVLEATSVILRASLLKIFRQNLVDLFSDKPSMNLYFDQFGLRRIVGKRKSHGSPPVSP